MKMSNLYKNSIGRSSKMSVIDRLEIIDGYFDGDRFIMRSIAGYPVDGAYKANGLRSMARLIEGDDPINLIIDKERTIFIPVEKNEQLKQELFMIAGELEREKI